MADLDVGNPPEEFMRLAKEYGDTVYGRWAKHLLVKGRGYANREERMAALEEILKAAPDFPVADECLFILAGHYRDSGEPEKAIRYFEEVRRKYPEGPFAPEAAKWADIVRQRTLPPTTRPAGP